MAFVRRQNPVEICSRRRLDPCDRPFKIDQFKIAVNLTGKTKKLRYLFGHFPSVSTIFLKQYFQNGVV